MAKKKESKQKKMTVRVDFTPMVDMLMLLITFFMLCTSLSKPSTMELTMPSNDENQQEDQKNEAKASQTVTIYVCADDKLYYVEYDNDGTAHDLAETTWGNEGIRDVLRNHVIGILAGGEVVFRGHHHQLPVLDIKVVKPVPVRFIRYDENH